MVPTTPPIELVVSGPAEVIARAAQLAAGVARTAATILPTQSIAALHQRHLTPVSNHLNVPIAVPIHFVPIHSRSKYAKHTYYPTQTAERLSVRRLSYHSSATLPRPKNSTGHSTTDCRALSHGLIATKFGSAFGRALDRLLSAQDIHVCSTCEYQVIEPTAPLVPMREFASVAFPSRHRVSSKITNSILPRPWVTHKIKISSVSRPLTNSKVAVSILWQEGEG